MMDDFKIAESLREWLTLYLAPKLSVQVMLRLIEHYGSPGAVLALDTTALQALYLPDDAIDFLQNPDGALIQRQLAWVDAHEDHHLITLQDLHYPQRLKEIAVPPPLLYVHGKLSSLATPQFAMVGSRNPTQAGREAAFEFGHALSEAGLTITSGMALGIDAASHQGALQAQGLTIAVLGTGIDVIYPRRHAKLKDSICQNGALVTEFPLGTAPKPERFPQRNRIVAGMSLGTLVVEAALRSGSLITARLANEQGREVFAMPSSIHNPTGRGCLQLIQNGAKLVTCTADILEELVDIQPNKARNSQNIAYNGDAKPLDTLNKKLLECIGFEATAMDTVLARSGLDFGVIAPTLLNLELSGYICTTTGGYIRVK